MVPTGEPKNRCNMLTPGFESGQILKVAPLGLLQSAASILDTCCAGSKGVNRQMSVFVFVPAKIGLYAAEVFFDCNAIWGHIQIE